MSNLPKGYIQQSATPHLYNRKTSQEVDSNAIIIIYYTTIAMVHNIMVYK